MQRRGADTARASSPAWSPPVWVCCGSVSRSATCSREWFRRRSWPRGTPPHPLPRCRQHHSRPGRPRRRRGAADLDQPDATRRRHATLLLSRMFQTWGRGMRWCSEAASRESGGRRGPGGAQPRRARSIGGGTARRHVRWGGRRCTAGQRRPVATLLELQLVGSVNEIPAVLGPALLAHYVWAMLTRREPARFGRAMGRLALGARTVEEAERRVVIAPGYLRMSGRNPSPDNGGQCAHGRVPGVRTRRPRAPGRCCGRELPLVDWFEAHQCAR